MNQFRVLAFVAVGHKLEKALRDHSISEKDGITPSCLSCESFNEEKEICNAANGTRPPARIIALGCNLYHDKDSIPF